MWWKYLQPHYKFANQLVLIIAWLLTYDCSPIRIFYSDKRACFSSYDISLEMKTLETLYSTSIFVKASLILEQINVVGPKLV